MSKTYKGGYIDQWKHNCLTPKKPRFESGHFQFFFRIFNVAVLIDSTQLQAWTVQKAK